MKSKIPEIVLFTDPNCDMEKLEVDGEILFEGNDWDYHLSDTVSNLKDIFKKLGIKAKFSQKEYEYE